MSLECKLWHRYCAAPEKAYGLAGRLGWTGLPADLRSQHPERVEALITVAVFTRVSAQQRIGRASGLWGKKRPFLESGPFFPQQAKSLSEDFQRTG